MFAHSYFFQIVHTTCVHKNFGTEHKSEIILQFEVIEVLQNMFTVRRLFKEGIHYLMQSKSNLLVDIYNIWMVFTVQVR